MAAISELGSGFMGEVEYCRVFMILSDYIDVEAGSLNPKKQNFRLSNY